MFVSKQNHGFACMKLNTVTVTFRQQETEFNVTIVAQVQEEKLRLRLDTFYTQTKPVIDYYRKQGVVRDEEISVSINRLAKEVAEDIVADIKK